MKNDMKLQNTPKILVVHSPQGGSGKSSIACHTALFLSQNKYKTLLVDMALYGSIVSMLQMKRNSSHGISGILHRIELGTKEVDATQHRVEMIKNHVEKRDEFATLDILCAGNPIQMEGIMPETMDWIIQALTASSYEYIIIDTSSELSVNVVKLLEIAHLVVIPVIQDVNCAWKLWMLKEILENINISMDKTKVIVNRCKKQYGFYNDEYEMELGFEILGEMKEFDASFQRQINQGKMISKQRNKQAYQSFCTMTQRMCELVNIIKK